MNTLNKSNFKKVVYAILILILLSHLSLVASHIDINIINLHTPYFLEQRTPLEVISIEPISRSSLSYNIIYSNNDFYDVFWIIAYILIQYLKGRTYQYHHFSRLFIRLQKLLLPRQNTSKFKTPLLLTETYS